MLSERNCSGWISYFIFPLVVPIGTPKEAAVSLSIVKYDQSGNVVGTIHQISKYRDFRNRDFEELYDYASTSKTRESTKMGREEDIDNRKKHKQHT